GTPSAACICASMSISATSARHLCSTPGTMTSSIAPCAPARSKNPARPVTKTTGRTADAAPPPLRFMDAGMRPIHFACTSTRGLTSVSCRSDCYRKVTNVRVRPVPEMSTCLVFTPDNPEVYTLNPTAWLILQLCDGRPKAAIADSYHAAVEPMLSREE